MIVVNVEKIKDGFKLLILVHAHVMLVFLEKIVRNANSKMVMEDHGQLAKSAQNVLVLNVVCVVQI